MQKMERGTVEIELGDQKFTIKVPLSLGQARMFQPAFYRYNGTLTKTENYDGLIDAFMAALSRDYPQFTRAQLLALDCSPRELLDAADKLGFATGLFSKEEQDAAAKKKAEMEAEAALLAAGKTVEAKASTGPSSTAS